MFWDLSGFYEFSAMLWFGTPNLIGTSNILPFCAPKSKFGRPKLFGLPFSRLNRLTGPFGLTESGVFGRPMGFRSAVFWAERSTGPFGSTESGFSADRLDFRSTNFGLGCFPGLFSNGFNNGSFWAYGALAHDLINVFKEIF